MSDKRQQIIACFLRYLKGQLLTIQSECSDCELCEKAIRIDHSHFHESGNKFFLETIRFSDGDELLAEIFQPLNREAATSSQQEDRISSSKTLNGSRVLECVDVNPDQHQLFDDRSLNISQLQRTEAKKSTFYRPNNNRPTTQFSYNAASRNETQNRSRSLRRSRRQRQHSDNSISYQTYENVDWWTSAPEKSVEDAKSSNLPEPNDSVGQSVAPTKKEDKAIETKIEQTLEGDSESSRVSSSAILDSDVIKNHSEECSVSQEVVHSSSNGHLDSSAVEVTQPEEVTLSSSEDHIDSAAVELTQLEECSVPQELPLDSQATELTQPEDCSLFQEVPLSSLEIPTVSDTTNSNQGEYSVLYEGGVSSSVTQLDLDAVELNQLEEFSTPQEVVNSLPETSIDSNEVPDLENGEVSEVSTSQEVDEIVTEQLSPPSSVEKEEQNQKLQAISDSIAEMKKNGAMNSLERRKMLNLISIEKGLKRLNQEAETNSSEDFERYPCETQTGIVENFDAVLNVNNDKAKHQKLERAINNIEYEVQYENKEAESAANETTNGFNKEEDGKEIAPLTTFYDDPSKTSSTYPSVDVPLNEDLSVNITYVTSDFDTNEIHFYAGLEDKLVQFVKDVQDNILELEESVNVFQLRVGQAYFMQQEDWKRVEIVDDSEHGRITVKLLDRGEQRSLSLEEAKFVELPKRFQLANLPPLVFKCCVSGTDDECDRQFNILNHWQFKALTKKIRVLSSSDDQMSFLVDQKTILNSAA